MDSPFNGNAVGLVTIVIEQDEHAETRNVGVVERTGRMLVTLVDEAVDAVMDDVVAIVVEKEMAVMVAIIEGSGEGLVAATVVGIDIISTKALKAFVRGTNLCFGI